MRRYVYSGLGEARCDEMEFSTDPAWIPEELTRVEEVQALINFAGDLPLDGVSDIREILHKIRIEGFYVAPDDFIRIRSFLSASASLRGFAAKRFEESGERFPWFAARCSGLYLDRILEHNISITIDDNGTVKDTASANLRRIRKDINSQSEKLRKSLARILKATAEKEYAREDIITQRDGRFVIPVKVENKNNVPGIIHGASSTGQTVFVEPSETIILNNELTELHFEERREIEKILRELAQQVKNVADKLLANCLILSEIDFVQAKAKYAIELSACKPCISSNEVELITAYHPVLLQTHKRTEVVPLDFSIGKEFNTLVISGPNAGGKTVVLKTVGLLHIMLQHGLLVPVDPKSKMKIFDSVFVSIGDEQSIENDLSTFSSHLKSVKNIIDESDSGSLVMIDEIASGTDPVLGSALSSAILKSLSERGSYTVVTTHNSELKEFAYATKNIENASLEFDSVTLSPTFRFSTGIPGQSFTFEIARKFDFPDSILNESKAYLTENEDRLEDLLKELNETKQRYDELKRKTDIENVRLSGLTRLYDEKLTELVKSEKVLKQKAKLEADSIVKDARKLIEKTVKELREEKLSPKAAKELIESERKAIEESIVLHEEPASVGGDIHPGDTVRLRDSNTSGEVMEISGNELTLNINGFTVKVNISEAERISASKALKQSVSSATELNEKPVELSLDLRGKYSYEIKDILERFLYEAITNGLNQVNIVHGKGSGKLREEVRRQLKGMKFVKSFRSGNWNEGDAGVTVVEI